MWAGLLACGIPMVKAQISPRTTAVDGRTNLQR
jgi:hypothetical protein